MTKSNTVLRWETHFPLLTNPSIVGAWLKAMAATYLFCMLIVGVVFLIAGEADTIPFIALIFMGGVLGVTVLGFLIMLLVYGNKSHARFTLSDKGITYESLDKRAKTLSRLAVVAGFLAGSASAAGSGLLSISNEKVECKWSGVFKAVYKPSHQTILIQDKYRTLLHLYCTADNFEQVKEIVELKFKC